MKIESKNFKATSICEQTLEVYPRVTGVKHKRSFEKQRVDRTRAGQGIDRQCN